MKRGHLIAIEGVDGVGKNTQSKLLVEYFKKTNGECQLFSFPRYESPTGKIIADFLNGNLNHLTLEDKYKLYANDRLAAKDEINSFLDKGINVVCDRYVYSNVAYFTSLALVEGKDSGYISNLEKEILNLEFKINNLPLPSSVVILNLPIQISRRLVLSKKPRDYTDKKEDIFEKNEEVLFKVSEYFQKQFTKNILDCSQLNLIKSIEEINKELIQKVLSDLITFNRSVKYE